MGILKKIFNTFVYNFTDKPEHYVHVDKPKTLQDHRQVQYNNWCKRYGVYNGSYLPQNPETLNKKGKGWKENSGSKDKTKRNFERKSTGQIVRYDAREFKNGKWIDEHYHWENETADTLAKSKKDQKNYKYRDRYGKICAYKSPESHLAPLDKKYNFKK